MEVDSRRDVMNDAIIFQFQISPLGKSVAIWYSI